MSVIVGSGLAGLIAAHVFPNSTIQEARAAPMELHQALLRFRTDKVSKLTGIDFRQVQVRKGIYFLGGFRGVNIQIANLYSRKILNGAIEGDRSIWSLASAARWVAPESLYSQLIDSVYSRIEFNAPFDFSKANPAEPVISTAPLPLTLGSLGLDSSDSKFRKAAITVERFRVPNCDAHQTVYFPSEDHSMYRASITGSLLIVEHTGHKPRGPWRLELERAFALSSFDAISSVSQSFGKIVPIEDRVRKQLLFGLTHEYGIYSLGRFATWRNILLDDVVDDAAAIKRLMRVGPYDLRRQT